MFSYDVTTTVGKVRLLLGDVDATKANFSDEELNAILQITLFQFSGPAALNIVGVGGGLSTQELLFMACAAAVDSLAARVASSADGRTVNIGDYKITGKDQVDSLHAVAQRFRDAIDNIPAWGIIEENNCGFNELTIMRNWILRAEF